MQKIEWKWAAALALGVALAGGAMAQGQNAASLRSALHLSAEQESAWDAYQAAVAPDPQAEAQRRAAAAMMPTLPTPRRIDLMTAEMARDVAAMRSRGAAVKAFYATLTPEQQRIFDEQTVPRTQYQDRAPPPPGQ